MDLKTFENLIPDDAAGTPPLPVLFIGHGNPMNAIQPTGYHQSWQKIGQKLPVPKAILCISAHWETRGTRVTYMDKPKTIHDFGGFPKELFDVQYPAPGSPHFANLTIEALHGTDVKKDFEWGLDHGCWSVIKPMFPKANIPVFQLSLDYLLRPEDHYKLGMQLNKLRRKGVLIIGSGNIVHNLGRLNWENKAFDWAIDFDKKVKDLILQENFHSLVGYKNLGAAAALSIPTPEHYLPLLYILAMKEKGEELSFFNESIDLGSVSMTSVFIGKQ